MRICPAFYTSVHHQKQKREINLSLSLSICWICLLCGASYATKAPNPIAWSGINSWARSYLKCHLLSLTFTRPNWVFQLTASIAKPRIQRLLWLLWFLIWMVPFWTQVCNSYLSYILYIFFEMGNAYLYECMHFHVVYKCNRASKTSKRLFLDF